MHLMMTELCFGEKYGMFRNTVFSVIFNYLKNTDDALDIMQEVFIRLYQTDTEFQSDEHMKAWLIRVAANLSKNFLRDNMRRQNEVVTEDIPYFDKSTDSDLLRMVLALPEKYRIPIHLHYYEGYQVSEIAQILEMPVSTVKVHLMRGREKLRGSLEMEVSV